MKKLLTMCVMLWCVMMAMAYEFTVTTAEGYELKYEVLDAGTKEVECQGMVDKSTAGAADLVIPDLVKYNDIWYKVTSIGYQAFYDCSDFTGSLTIGAGVTSIGSSAFDGCRFVDLHINMDNIPAAEYDKYSDKYYTCWGTGLTGKLTLGDNVKSIGSSAFYGCSGFTGSLTIPDGVTSIGNLAFYECSGFTGGLTIPDGVTSIGDWAFSGDWDSAMNFTGSLVIPDGVTSIGYQAFSYCSGFTGSLTIGAGVICIGEEAFASCSGFTGSLTISNSVESIGMSAFDGCTFTDLYVNMKNIPARVSSYVAFWNSGVSFTGSLVIGDGVESIGDLAFYGCSNFTGSLTIPAGVESIGFMAFSDCSGFTGSLIIPASVTSIGTSAFYGCRGFTSVTNKAAVPQMIDEYAFGGVVIGSIPLYVPEESISLYEDETVWKDFMSISKIDNTSLEDVVVERPFVQMGGSLVFNDVQAVRVYGVNGSMVYCGVTDRVVLHRAGTYVVQTAKGSFKVIIND